jgi:hypothetical protein
MKKYEVFAGLLPLLFLTTCVKPCGNTSEPQLSVSFYAVNLPAYTRVYGLGGKEAFPSSAVRGHYNFPVSLLADSIIYLFESPDRIDTLTVGYTRSPIQFESPRCGFTTGLYNVHLLSSTTFAQDSVRIDLVRQ